MKIMNDAKASNYKSCQNAHIKHYVATTTKLIAVTTSQPAQIKSHQQQQQM